ncbi:MAG: pyruvate kinase [Patescibacteria group bacterium]
MKRTKIITTIGPASQDDETLSKLIDAGANVFRFNMKHGETSWHSKIIEKAQKIADEKNIPLGMMIDLQGPEVRINTKNDFIKVERGEEIYFKTSFDSEKKTIKVPDKDLLNLLKEGSKLLIDDGFYEFEVVENNNGEVLAKSLRSGRIGDRKGMNIPAHKLNLPSLIKDDLKKLDLAAKREIDYVALSFTRTKEDVKRLRKEMKKRGIDAHIVAKIENKSALENLEKIIKEADGVMVARGDLGIETPLEEIAYWQKKIITKCREMKTPVIVATQMLQSMTDNPIPTRAEVTDVANAIFNGTDAVMLSNETAMGKYPIESVKAMKKIIAYNEKGTTFEPISSEPETSSDLIMRSAVEMLEKSGKVNFEAVLVFTKDGETAKQVSSLRPKLPIFAITNKKEVIEKLNICYGIENRYTVFNEELLKNPNKIIEQLRKEGLLKKGKKVLMVQAQHWDLPELSKALTIVNV